MHNFLMDASAMYPEGFHPAQTAYKRDYSGWANYLPRSTVGVKYYFADFGISVHKPEKDRSRFVTGNLGRDRRPPELSVTVPYDPFKLDVFIVGNMLKQEFCDVIIPLSVFFGETHSPPETLQCRIPSAPCQADDPSRPRAAANS